MEHLGRLGFLRKSFEKCASNAKVQVTVSPYGGHLNLEGLRAFGVLEAGLEKILGKPGQVLPDYAYPNCGRDSKIMKYLGTWGWGHDSARKALVIQA